MKMLDVAWITQLTPDRIPTFQEVFPPPASWYLTIIASVYAQEGNRLSQIQVRK
jgi:hypothetical protein